MESSLLCKAPDIEVLRGFLRRRFPGAAKIELAGEGWGAVAFWVDGDIVRFAKEDFGDLEKEAEALGFIREKARFSVEVPEIEIAADAEIPYAIHRALQGRNWTIGYIMKLPEAKRRRFFSDAAKFLAILHKVDVAEAKARLAWLEVLDYHVPDYAALYPFLKDHFSAREYEVLRTKNEAAHCKPKSEIVLVHGDFSGPNSLLDGDDRLCGVFDFGNANLGEREVDFWRLYRADKPEFMMFLLEAYERASGVAVDLERVREYCLMGTFSAVWWVSQGCGVKGEDEMARFVRKLRWFSQ